MEKEFTTYEISLKLKELGFDEKCFGYYRPMKSWMMEGNKFNPAPHFHGCNWSSSDNTMYFMYVSNSFGDRTSTTHNSYFTKANTNIAVPLWQQVIEYIKNTYDIYILIIPANRCYNIEISKYDENDDRNVVLDLDGLEFKDFLSYRDAREQAILKAIELIKDIK